MVALSGPVPGLLLTWVGARYLYSQPGGPPDVYKTFLGLLVVVNGVNLLPFSPLDGGAVVSRLFLSRRPGPYVLFSILGPLVLSIAAAFARDWWFIAIMAFVATLAFARRSVPYAVNAAREEFAGSNTPFGELSNDQQRRLYDLAISPLHKAGWKSLGTSNAADSKRRVRIIARYVRDIHADARVQSASTRELAMGLTLYAAALGLLMPFIVHRFF